MGFYSRAAEALGKLSDRRAVEPLIAKMNTLMAYPILSLGEIGDSRAVTPIFKLLRDNSLNTSITKPAREALKKLKAAGAPVTDEMLGISRRIVKEGREHERKMGQETKQAMRREKRLREADSLCDKALNHMRLLIEQNCAIPSPPYPKQIHDELVGCIAELSEIALMKREEGIAVPKEAQVIQEVYRNRLKMSGAAWIMIECEKALKKLGAL